MTPDEWLAELPTRAKVINMMTEPHRIYHNLSHAMEIAWLSFDPINNDSEDEEFYYYTAFYHDIVYKPGARDNEEASAKEFLKDIHKFKYNDPYLLGNVKLAIELSANHFQETAYDQNDRISKFLDWDLWGLGAAPDQYDLNTKKIRLEFNNVSDADWVKGRRDWLSKALNTDRIYRLASDREAQAGANLQREYNSLL
jgi:predicted metal-dependent HD superfamily phosphohydrolase